MEWIPSWEPNRFSVSEEIPRILWNPMVHHRVSKGSVQVRGNYERLVTWLSLYGEELLAGHPTTMLEDHPLSAVRDCLFGLFAATLHIGSRFSIRNMRTRHAVVTGTHKHGDLRRTRHLNVLISVCLSVYLFSAPLSSWHLTSSFIVRGEQKLVVCDNGMLRTLGSKCQMKLDTRQL